jgi:mycoredoxin
LSWYGVYRNDRATSRRPDVRRNLFSAATCLLAAVVIGLITWPTSSVAGAIAMVAGLAASGGLTVATLRREPHTPWALASAQVSDRRAVIFWKPTCTYCTRLRRTLRDDSGIVWVNVWVDQEANREVRRHNGGDEYTPTALVGARVLRNPTAADVRSTLRA